MKTERQDDRDDPALEHRGEENEDGELDDEMTDEKCRRDEKCGYIKRLEKNERIVRRR